MLLRKLQTPGISNNDRGYLTDIGTFWVEEQKAERVKENDGVAIPNSLKEEVPAFRVRTFKGEALNADEVNKLAFLIARIVGKSILSTIKKKGLTEKNKDEVVETARRVTYIQVAKFLSTRAYETRIFDNKKKPVEPGFIVSPSGVTPWAGKGGYNSRTLKGKKRYLYRRKTQRGGAPVIVPIALGGLTAVMAVLSYAVTVACGRAYRKRQAVLEEEEEEEVMGTKYATGYATAEEKEADIAALKAQLAATEAEEKQAATAEEPVATEYATEEEKQADIAALKAQLAATEAEEKRAAIAATKAATGRPTAEEPVAPGVCTKYFCRAYTPEDIHSIASACASAVEEILESMMEGNWAINNVVNIGMENVYEKMAHHLLINKHAGGANNVNVTYENIGKDAAKMAIAAIKNINIKIRK